MKYLCLYFFSTCFALAQVQEELKVTVRELRVHVIDKEGDPVEGLGPADFLLESRKTSLDLSFFEEVNLLERVDDQVVEGQSETEVSRFMESDNDSSRKIVLFVDSSHLTSKNFASIKASLKDFIRERVRPQDRLSLYHWDREVTEMAGFYQSRQVALEAVDNMKYEGSMLREILRTQRSIHREIKNWSESPIRSPYVLIINNLIKEKARFKAEHYRTFYLNMLTVAYTLEQMSGPKSIFLFTGGSYLEYSSLFGETASLSERLGQVLNRANATIYTLLVKNPTAIGGQLGYLRNTSAGFMSQLKSYSTFPPGGLNRLDFANNTISEDTYALESGPAAAAKETGGLFLKTYTDSSIADQLARAERVSSHYYRFAFDIEATKDKTKLTLKLKDKPKGWKLLYGRDIAKTQPHEELDEDERRVASQSMLLYGSKFRDDFDSTWDAKIFEQGNDGFRVAMMGRFPSPKSFNKGMEIGFAALAEDRSMLDLVTTVVSKVPVKEEFAFYDVLLTQKQPTFLRFYARSLDTGDYVIHEMKADYQPGQGRTQVSEVLMDQPSAEKILSLNQLNLVKQEGETISERISLRSELDPFRMEDKIYAPQVAPYIFERGIAGFMFHLENPEEPDVATYQVQYLVKSQQGYEKVPGRIIASWRDSVGNIHFLGQLKTDILKKGAYSLLVRVKKAGTQEQYSQGVAFELI